MNMQRESGAGSSRNGQNQGWGGLDALDWVIYIGIILVTIVVPFLYSRQTTENFLTPKEFTSKIALGFLAALFCLRFVVNGRAQLARTRIDLPLAAFFGLSVASLLWNDNVPSAIRDLRGTFLILMLVPLILNTVRERWQFEGVIWAMIFAGIATSTLGIMESYNIYFKLDPVRGFTFVRDEILGGQIDYSAWYIPLFPQLASKEYAMTSIVSTFGNRNYLGTFAMFTAFFPLGFFFYYRHPLMKALSISLFSWMVVGLYITRCRAALGGIVAGVLFIFAMLVIFDRSWKFVKRHSAFFMIVAFILVGGMLVTAATSKSGGMIDKLKTTFTMDRKVSNVYERIWVWYATLRNWLDNPPLSIAAPEMKAQIEGPEVNGNPVKRVTRWLLGGGYGSFKHFFPLQEAKTFDDENKETFTAVTFRQAHNDWLQVLAELGLIGFGLLFWLIWRFFRSIYHAIREDTRGAVERDFRGEHILLITLGAAMVAQMVAAIPDFPFHRIETALYAVIVLALVPVCAETLFFTRQLPLTQVKLAPDTPVWIGIAGVVVGLLAINFEVRCWQADIRVRTAEAYLGQRLSPEAVVQAKKELISAIQTDPLPGDPYLKMATILELENKPQEALDFANRAWKNINFNARSTYHSVIFRRMHIYYHIMQDKKRALEEALTGQYMTAGDARSIYYFYAGKIALELNDAGRAEWALGRALNYPSFEMQAAANLAVVKASLQKWPEALALAASVSARVSDADPTMLDIVGISASALGQLATAETALRKAVAISPGQPVYKRDLGSLLVRAGRRAEGRTLLEEAYESTDLPPSLGLEIKTALASLSVQQRKMADDLLASGSREEAVSLLRELYVARLLPDGMKADVEARLRSLGAMIAEQPIVPAEKPPVPPASPSEPAAPAAPAAGVASEGGVQP
ncbi:MAG TPA: O-antigen ligase family protein [Candidatus Ozemobacteraceae bacterium]|nr:O-antigen ligase family protein [Candidatus Ozemobacteraceae bacterium]